MNKVYIAGPLFDDHERSYLENISAILEKYSYETFLPHRDAGLVKGEFTQEKKSNIFNSDMEFLQSADIVVALLQEETLTLEHLQKLVLHSLPVKF